MRRAGKPKKKKREQQRISSHFIMSVIMPCVTVALKDEFNLNGEQLRAFSKRFDRYIGYVGDGHITLKDLEEQVRVVDSSK